VTARLAILLVAALVAAGAVVGCGDDEEGDAQTAGATSAETAEGASEEGGGDTAIATSSLSKKEFLKEANAACVKRQKGALGSLTAYEEANPANEKPLEEWYADMIRAVILPPIEEEIEEIRAIGAPAGDEQQVEAFLEAEQKDVEEVAALESVKTPLVVEDHFVESGDLAREYGLDRCSHSGAAGTF